MEFKRVISAHQTKWLRAPDWDQFEQVKYEYFDLAQEGILVAVAHALWTLVCVVTSFLRAINWYTWSGSAINAH